MKFYNTYKGLLSAALISLSLGSCSEGIMDDINKDNDHTTSVPAKFILADAITSTAFNNVGGDFNTYFSIYVEHTVGVDNQLANAEKRNGEPSSSSTFNNVWGNLYSSLMHSRIVIDKCSDEVTANYSTKGMGEVLAALNAGLITDAFGDAPFSQAGLPNLANGQPQFMTPAIDKQEDIYKAIHEYLDAAIVDLPKGDKTDAARSYDLLYNGDASKWLKLAYGLKARYTLHTIARSEDKEADLEKILTYIDNSFSSIDEQAAFNIYDATNLNPFFNFQWSRDGLAASESFAEKLVARNDPRLSRIFAVGQGYAPKGYVSGQITGTDDEDYWMAENGTPAFVRYEYNTPIFVYSQTAPTMLMSYHELLFIKAEVLARLGRNDEAKVALNEAVKAAVSNAEVAVKAAFNAPTVLNYGGVKETTKALTDADVDAYFDATVNGLFDANPLKEIMVQKYIAFLGAAGESTECYNDVRRLKAMNEDFIELKNPFNAEKFPNRCAYGADDVSANPNVEAAYGNGQYVYSEPVWWAGGNR